MNIHSRTVINSEGIYNDLLHKIITLEYEPGTGISENELCEVYGATRHAIRGALAILKEKGFIEVFPQKGTYVSLIDLKMIDDILFLRSAIEQETLHALLKNEDNSQLLKELRECLEKQNQSYAQTDGMAKFYELDEEFHSLLLKAAGRESVQKLYQDSYLHVRRWRNMEVGALKRMASLPHEHEDILDAIERHDENEARRLMFNHIDSVSQFGEEMKSKYPKYFI